MNEVVDGASIDREAERTAEKERKAEAAVERIHKGAHWLDWMDIAEGLETGQVEAIRSSGSNGPYGRGYTKAFGKWLSTRPWAKNIDKGTRSNLLWIVEHRNDVERWREERDPNERAKMAHPTTVRRKYESYHQSISKKDPNAPKKETGREALVRENEDLWAKVKKLERQVESGDGSLFDLRRDSIETIVDTIAGNVPLGRFQSLQRAMTEKLAELKVADKAKMAKAG